MSITRSVGLLANTSMEPLVPAGMMAALATTVPVKAFKLAASGIVCPVGQAVRYPSGPGGTRAKSGEWACAVPGRLQALDRMGNVRVLPPPSDGPPNGPAAVR